MPKYEVLVPEIHYQTVIIDAPDKEQAIARIMGGDGDQVDGALEFSCTHEEYLENMLTDIDSFDWAVTEIGDTMCERCGEDKAVTTRCIEYKQLDVCQICANEEGSDDE